MALAKWILGGLGWSLGGPIGGVIGFFVGKAFEGHSDRPKPRSDRERTSEGDLHMALLVLIAAVMKADGRVTHSELDYVKAFLRKNYSEKKSLELLSALRDILKQDIPLVQVCRQVKDNTDYTTRYHMFDFLVGLAAADNEFSSEEHSRLNSIRIGLGINMSDYLSMCARYGFDYASNSGYSQQAARPVYAKDPFKVLGLESNATDDEVKKAYRRLAMKYHPDKVASLGEEMQKNAAAQFREINEAYEAIKSQRGMK